MATKNERTKVFVPDDSLVWVNGEIVRELDGSNFEIVITDTEYVKNGSLSETKIVTLNKVLDALPLQNDIPVSGVDDMTTLNYLHEASILDNLKRRFYHKHPYTYTGDICIAVSVIFACKTFALTFLSRSIPTNGLIFIRPN
jgi:myosin-5